MPVARCRRLQPFLPQLPELEHFPGAPRGGGEQFHCSRDAAGTGPEDLLPDSRLYLYRADCARTCREAGLLNILVSAGYVNEGPLDDLLPYLDAANIDLKSFSEDIYRKVSRASLAPVLRTLEKMRDAGVWLEITNLLIPGINDEPGMLREMCRWLVDNGFAGAPLHFSRFFPQYRMREVPPTPIGTLRMAEEIARECGIRYVHLGNV